MDDRRQYIRKTLSSTVNVFDRNTHDYIGLVADYSDGGLLITSSVNPVEVGKTYQYLLMSQKETNDEIIQRGPVDVVSVWCDRNSSSFYGIGFQIVTLSQTAGKLLESCSG